MKQISQSERIIMDVLWSRAPLRATEIADEVAAEGWNIRTVKTLLSRLVKKDVVSTEADGRHYLYSPIINKEAYGAYIVDGVSKSYFEGDPAPLLLHLAKSKDLSTGDIDEITALLSDLKAAKTNSSKDGQS
ncbi:MAG: BlaI/MecI/CopY family transcriptional regulator [Litorimonas sp.]